MRTLLRLAGLALLLAFIPAAHAANPSGNWKGSFDFQGDPVPLTFHLTVAGNAVTGSIEGLPITPAEIHEGKLDGSKLTFWVNTEYEGETYKLLYTGTLSEDGNQIAFTFGTDDGSWSAELTAIRSE